MVLIYSNLKLVIITHPVYTETELVLLIKSNSRSGYEYLYANYSTALYGIIRKTVFNEDDANDVLQDVFVKIWSGITSYDTNKGRLYTWFFNIARNTSIDFLRSVYHNKKSKTVDIDIAEFMREPRAELLTDAIGLKKLVYRLEPKYQILIDLAY